ncbi:hypothetical protein SAMN05661099_0361 [Daejeonella lutea]|uniref:Uncharacterized protein n=1 Tax=Daejeonella lutea TaxID=572036 RepID=A0A1T5A6H8_9SPHI|nr:hypothetical protein SAMN05661099_0361 [Daejeonella lutea]
MKFLAIFLSVLMLAIAFDICPDTDSCSDSDRTELNKSSGKQSEDGERCSPFCHCLRCPFSVLLPLTSAEFFNSNSLQRNLTTASQSRTLSVQNAIWQPPKAA